MLSQDKLTDLAIKIGQLLSVDNQSIVTAESCTGGWIGKELTAIPGSSRWYGYGFITYSNFAKINILGVSKDLIKKEGAVCEEVVREMALGAINSSGADYSIAVSGIAGPSGGTIEKPVGTVCFAIGSKDNLCTFTKNFEGDRDTVRYKSLEFAFDSLIKRLQLK